MLFGTELATSLAAQIAELHKVGAYHHEKARDSVIQCGLLLIEMRDTLLALPKGRRQWVLAQKELPFSRRTTRRYIWYAEHLKQLPPKLQAQAALVPMRDGIAAAEKRQVFNRKLRHNEMRAELDDSELPDEVFECDADPDAGPTKEKLVVKRARAQYPSDWDPDIDGCPEMADDVVVALNDGTFLHTLTLEIHRIRRHIEAKRSQPEFAFLMYQDTVQCLKDAARNLADARPRCPCPKCQQRGCDFCTPRGHGDQSAKPEGSKPLGWVDHWRWKRHVKDRDLAMGKRKEKRNDK